MFLDRGAAQATDKAGPSRAVSVGVAEETKKNEFAIKAAEYGVGTQYFLGIGRGNAPGKVN